MENEPPLEPLRPNDAQDATLRELCSRYHVDYDASHYLVHSPDSWMMSGWGWLGGVQTTIFVGVSPEGEAHS